MWFDRKPQHGSPLASFATVGSGASPRLETPPWIRAKAPACSAEFDSLPPKAPSQFPPALASDPPSPVVAAAIPSAPEATAAVKRQRDEATAALEAARRDLERKQTEGLIRLQTAIEELGAVRAALASEMEEQLVQLAGKIARKVVQRELSTAPDILLELAREGIDALGEKGSLVVKLGVLIDEPTTEAFLARLGEKAAGCRVLFDPELPPYACVVEGQAGHVDESIEERLDNVMRSVLADHPT